MLGKGKGPSIKGVRSKSRTPPLCPQNVRTAQTPFLSPCPCGHTINFKIRSFNTKKCERPHLKNTPLSEKCPHWTNPLSLTADAFYGQLQKASYININATVEGMIFKPQCIYTLQPAREDNKLLSDK